MSGAISPGQTTGLGPAWRAGQRRTGGQAGPFQRESPAQQSSVTPTARYNGLHHVTWTSVNAAVNGFSYDASGNTQNDGVNQYWSDAEGQLCAVENLRGITQYVYDAEGARIAKGTLSSVPNSSTATCAPPQVSGVTLTSSNGLSLTSRYLVDQGGDQVTELSEGSAETWAHSNIWAGGKLTATYDPKGIHYELTDPLGTKRVQANALGQADEQCTGLPFGNDLGNPLGANCIQMANSLSTADDATEHHFTGKERDTESGNDYFGARYYASSMGRFMSPDWSAKAEPVPYAKLDNPQSLNLYAYMRNNPLGGTDPDGHVPEWFQRIMNGITGKGLKTDAEVAPKPKPGQYTVTLNSRKANIPGGGALHSVGADHEWISTSDGKSVGMGDAKNGGQIPDKNGGSTPTNPLAPTQLIDEHGDVPTDTHTYTNVDKGAMDSYLTPGTQTGPWIPGVNDCNTWAENALGQSIPHDVYNQSTDTMTHNAVVYADGSVHVVQPQQ
jgi:RHS repeat-associated protein